MTRRVRAAAAIAVLLGACGGDDDGDAVADPTATASGATPPSTTRASVAGGRCLVRLHGKGGRGADTVTEDDVTVISPTGNADGWGARQWLYFPDEEYAAGRQFLAGAVEGCRQIIINGFSNGASFAAALYCRGETFEGRLVGVVIDDPVPDHGVDGCTPDPSVAVTLYWTGALDATATPGWPCAESDWTCAGGETIGIDAYASALGAEIQDSPLDDHQWYVDAPEVSAWPT